MENIDEGLAHDIFSERYEVERYAEAKIRCMEKLNFPEEEIIFFMEKIH
ncbi:MAG: hypothetical protein IJP62_13025 [Treponema sp.]|nr:hypothetical protein [Treponema sp.]